MACRVGFVGVGRLGLPCAVAVSWALGRKVLAYDANPDNMRKRKYEHMEAGATRDRSFQEMFDAADIGFTNLAGVVLNSDIIFVAVQTPHAPEYDGSIPSPKEPKDFDYSFLKYAVGAIAQHARRDQVIAVISTVLPSTIRREILPLVEGKCGLVYNPFFAAMGTCVSDFLSPEFVLLGGDNPEALQKVYDFYASFIPSPILRMSYESAELTKVAYNCHISMRITFSNTIMEIAHKTPGCNVEDVTSALKMANKRLTSNAYMTGGMVDGGACFTADTLVVTDVGPRRIADVGPEHNVLTIDGTFAPVNRRWERHYDGDIVKVKVEGALEVEATTNHPFHVVEDGRPIISDGSRSTNHSIREKLSSVKQVPAGELHKGHFVACPVQVGEEERPWYATDDYCWLAGWYLSEGYADFNQHGDVIRSGRISFYLHQKETEIADRLCRTLVKLHPPKTSGRGAGAKTTIQLRGDNGMSVRYGCKELAIRLCEDFGKGAAWKRLPRWVMNGSPETMGLVLQGLFQGDGHACKNGFQFTTVSPNLAFGVAALLERLGVCANLRSTPARVGSDGQGHRMSFDVRVRNYPDVERLAPIIGMTSKKPDQPKKYERSPLVSGKRMRRVLSLERSHFSGTVYNLWVDHPTHTYVTAAGAVSNCHPRDLIAMKFLTQKLHLSYDLFSSLAMSREWQTFWLARQVLKVHRDTLLPIYILGKAFKPGTNITQGSAALLLRHYLEKTLGVKCEAHDHFVDGMVAKDFLDGLKAPHIFVVATAHPGFFRLNLPKGSVVIDPHRKFPDQEGVKVIRIGEGAAV